MLGHTCTWAYLQKKCIVLKNISYSTDEKEIFIHLVCCIYNDFAIWRFEESVCLYLQDTYSNYSIVKYNSLIKYILYKKIIIVNNER